MWYKFSTILLVAAGTALVLAVYVFLIVDTSPSDTAPSQGFIRALQ